MIPSEIKCASQNSIKPKFNIIRNALFWSLTARIVQKVMPYCSFEWIKAKYICIFSVTFQGGHRFINIKRATSQKQPTITCCLSNKTHANPFAILMNTQVLNPRILSELLVLVPQKSHLAGIYIQSAQVITSNQCCHVWGAAAPTALTLFESVQKRGILWIDNTNITRNWVLLSLIHLKIFSWILFL